MKYQCSVCLKKYTNQSNLNKHLRMKHPQLSIRYEKSYLRCLEDGCKNTFKQQIQLRNHLKEVHGIQFEEIEFTVTTMSEFDEWKQKIEKETISFYCLNRKFTNHSFYYCNRSSTREHKRSNMDLYKRQEKSQRSCKIGSKCTSYIKLEHKNQDEIKVFWQKTHYGHVPEIQHIRIPKEDRQLVASKLISGVPPTKILQATGDSIYNHPKRIDLLTRDDIRNIKNSFKIESDSGKRHESDAISVDLWVKEFRQNEADGNPILFYKAQGMEGDGFSEDDFCLVFMNVVQKDMYQKFGGNIVAIDGTHGLNGYDFELTTLMVIDEFNQGFPAAFMFTNRKDTFVYCFFFDLIKTNAGPLQAKTFMSDLEGTFYLAWENVMGPTKHTLFCSWHVDRAWQSNLNKIIDKTKRSEVYKHMKVLQQKTEARAFHTSLEIFVNSLMDDDETIAFGKYFQSYYCSNFLKWAYCFRTDCGINTNMHLESMHKIIKYFYLERKVVRRLDRGLHAVMSYLKDRTLSRYIDLTKGKTTKQKRINFLKHNKSLTSSYDLVESHGGYHLTTKSLKTYDVKKIKSLKCCENLCTACQVCRHMYSCTCPDYVYNNVVCKHVHFMILYEKKNGPSTSSSSTMAELTNDEVTNTLVHQLALCKQSADDINENKKRYETAMAELSRVNIEDYDSEIVKEINSCLSKLTMLTRMKKISSSTAFSQQLNHESENKIKINPQIRFTSTKKKRKYTNNVCEKPNVRETDEIKNILTGGNSLFISKDKSVDHNYLL